MKNKKAITYLFLANTVSGISQGISLIAIPWYITNTLNRPALFGLMFLSATLFSIPWGTFAGTLVDKYDRRKIMLFIQAFGLLLVFSSALSGFVLQKDTLAMAMVVYFTTIIAYNIHYPNLYAFAQEITEKENYSKITSWLEIQGQTSFALAGMFAAVLLEGKFFSFVFGSWSLHHIFMLDAFTYFIALFFLYLIRYQAIAHRGATEGNVLNKFIEGLQYLNQNRKVFLFGISTGLVFASILVSSMFILPLFIKNVLHGSERVYGISEGVFAFGSLLSGIFISSLFTKTKLIKGLLVLHVIASIAFFAMAANQLIVLLYVWYAIIGFTNAGSRIMRVTFLFHVVPNRYIGRANSVFSVVNALIRVALIGLFSLGFFSENDNIKYALYVLVGLISIGIFVLGRYYADFKQLNQMQH